MQELPKRLQDRHVDCAEAVAKKAAADAASAATVSPDTPNVLQAMMQLRQAKSRAEAANKLALEAEKERDAAEKAVEEPKRQLQPKRARTDDPGTNSCVEKKFKLGARKYEEYKGLRFGNGDCALVVDV